MSRAASDVLWVDGYIRVSRVGLRRGERFISPTAQRESIDAWADRTGAVVMTVFEELDQPGDTFDRPLLAEALERIEQGISQGLVVDRVDRFGRSLVHGLLTIQRIQTAGGAVYAVQDGLDSTTDAGRLILRNMLSTGEWELDRRRQAWQTARRLAIARGTHQGARTPLGYRKTRSGRLRPHPKTGPIVTELFQRRAAGEAITSLGRWLESQEIMTSWGNYGWAFTSVRAVLRNPVYLGQVNSRPFVRTNAHPPLIDLATWQNAQGPRQPAAPIATHPALLSGIARCAGCSRPLMAAERRREGYTRYDCLKHHPAGTCPAPAHILGELLEPRAFEATLILLSRRRQVPKRELEEAQRHLDEAGAALASYRDSDKVLRTLGLHAFEDGVAARLKRLREARMKYARAQDKRDIHDLPSREELEARWPTMSVAQQRDIVRRVIDCIFVTAGRRGPDERITICPLGTAPPDLPNRQNKPSKMRPFAPSPTVLRFEPIVEIDPEVLAARLRKFLRGRDEWPAASEFRRAGRDRLLRQAVYQGGERWWAWRLGRRFNTPTQHSGPWTEERVRASLRIVLAGRETWPTIAEFYGTGLTTLHHAIGHTGGAERWAREFNLPAKGLRRRRIAEADSRAR